MLGVHAQIPSVRCSRAQLESVVMSRLISRVFGVVVFISAFAACSGGSNGISPTALQQQTSQGSAQPQAPANATTECSTPPVKSLRVTPSTLMLTVGGPAGQFIACTQYASTYVISVTPSGIVSVPSSATPVVNSTTGIKTALIRVTPLAPGSATITITDKKGNTATVAVNVVSPKALLYAGTVGAVLTYNTGIAATRQPINILTGPATGLGLEVNGIAFDARGDMYVASTGGGRFGTCLLEFAPGASGDAAPIAKICGPHTTLGTDLQDVKLDRAGNIYVSDLFNNDIAVFSPGSNGDVAPRFAIGGMNTQILQPNGIAFDASGNLFVTITAGLKPEVAEYAPGTSGNTAPIATLEGSNTKINAPHGLGFDSQGNLFVVADTFQFFVSAVLRFPPGASGNVAPAAEILAAPEIFTDPRRVAIDSSGLIYVSAESDIDVFAHDANGQSIPLAVISRAFTDRFSGLAVH
jgi:sugar lactone lactonase YvrE